MSREGIVERAEAPELRRVSPIWQWLFIGVLSVAGIGVLGAIALSEMRKGEEAPETQKEEKKQRLKFGIGDFQLPTFAKPEPEPEPEPESVPSMLELPLPEPAVAPVVEVAVPPPVPVADAPSGESPEEIARKRRLTGALSGSSDGGSAAPDGEADAASAAVGGGLDLTVTKAEASLAMRYEDLSFIVPKGTQIGCILNTAIQSDQTGMVSCTLPTDIYGADGTVVLLDRGSQAIGEYKTATLTYGKRRIYVVWSQVRTPEGVVIDIDSPGTGPLGRAGIGGHIDNHYWERVGIPMLMSIVSFGTESYLRDELTSEDSRFIEGATNDVLGPVIGELAKIKPTLNKNQGERINIFVARDLDLSSVYTLSNRYDG